MCRLERKDGKLPDPQGTECAKCGVETACGAKGILNFLAVVKFRKDIDGPGVPFFILVMAD